MKATLIKYCGSVENNVELLPRQSADVCKFDTFARRGQCITRKNQAFNGVSAPDAWYNSFKSAGER